MRPRVMVIITRSEIGGAQNYVLSMIRTLTSTYKFILVVGSDSYLNQKLARYDASITTHIVPALNSPNAVSALFKVRKLIKSSRPHLINSHSALASAYGRLANIGLRTPYVYSVHGWYFTENSSYIRRIFGPVLERLLSAFTDFWVTETEYDLQLGLKKNIIDKRKNAEVIANGVSESIKRDKPMQALSKYAVIFIGRISYQKNPALAINAISELPSDFSLTIYCDNAEDPELQNHLNTLGIENRVRLVDSEMKTSEVVEFYDLMLVTSRYEGMPLSVIEAMSAGLPIVSTNVCGINELVINGENGLLIDKHCPKSLSQAVISILKHPETAEKMGRRSREIYLSRHTLETMSKKLQDVFDGQIKLNELDKA